MGENPKLLLVEVLSFFNLFTSSIDPGHTLKMVQWKLHLALLQIYNVATVTKHVTYCHKARNMSS